jgi:hypothetical protein
LVGWSSWRRVVVRLANKLKQLKNPLHFCPLVHIFFIFYFLYFDIFEKYNVNVDLMKKINNDFEMDA